MSTGEPWRDLVPPVLWRALRRLRGARTRKASAGGAPEWEYLPEGWAYAAAHQEVRGWNVPDILSTYRRKWPRYVELVQGTGPLGVSHESDLANNAICTATILP